MAIEGVTNEMVLNAMFQSMNPEDRAVLCSVYGDPARAEPTAWGGTPWKMGSKCPLKTDRNNYVAISSFKASEEDGRYRRRKEQFTACHAIMVDDLGTKLALSSLPQSLIPSLVVETSPGNFQATFFLDRPMALQTMAEDAIKQIIAKLSPTGTDPGMAGVTRVLRLPEGINGKPKYRDDDGNVWRCRVHVWRPDIRTSWDELAHAFQLVEKNRRFVEPTDGVTRERMRGFGLVKQALRSLNLIKRESSGWMDITCPWLSEHTDRANTGSAVNPPSKANGYYGGFKCHHGHCESRNWGDLEEKVGRLIWLKGQRSKGPFTDPGTGA